MRIGDRALALFLVILGLGVIVATFGFPRYPGSNLVGPALFPRIIGVGFIACALAVLHAGRGLPASERRAALDPAFRDRHRLGAFLAVPATVLVYLALAETLGFIVTVTGLLSGLFLLFRLRPLRALLTAIVAAVLIHALFYRGLSVPLPWGILGAIAW